MTKAKFLREKALVELRQSIPKNLDLYRTGDFNFLMVDAAMSFDSKIEVVEEAMAQLKTPQGKNMFEGENCAIMLKAIPKLKPYEAADERLWTMLSHTLLLEHARKRWPIPLNDKDAVTHIQQHFFANSQRQLERDNIASRLWWMGHLCSRVDGMPLETALEVLLYRSDVRANIVERPTTAQSVPVFTAIIRRLAKSYKGDKKLFLRSTFRKLMVSLNGLGGYKLLDALDAKTVEGFIGKLSGD